MRSARLLLFTLLTVTPLAAPLRPAAAAEGKKILIHVKTALNKDDAQICVVPNVAWAAIQTGNEVTLLFDGSAVTSVTKGWGWRGWFGDTRTPMDRAGLPERERQALSEQLGYPLDKIPRNYGEYLRFLKEKGAKLYINKTMTVLYNIDADRLDSVLTPMLLKDMVGLLQSADRYLVY